MTARPGSLPLLQFALREMWTRQKGREITKPTTMRSRALKGRAKRAEEIFTRLTGNGEDKGAASLFQRLFTRLVTFGERQEDTRRVVSRNELGPKLGVSHKPWQTKKSFGGNYQIVC